MAGTNKDCGHSKWKSKAESNDESSNDLSGMFEKCAQITAKRNVEITVNSKEKT